MRGAAAAISSAGVFATRGAAEDLPAWTGAFTLPAEEAEAAARLEDGARRSPCTSAGGGGGGAGNREGADAWCASTCGGYMPPCASNSGPSSKGSGTVEITSRTGAPPLPVAREAETAARLEVGAGCAAHICTSDGGGGAGVGKCVGKGPGCGSCTATASRGRGC